MFANVGLYSYGSALLTFGLLTLLISMAQRKQISGLPAIAATLLTATWAGSVVFSSVQPYPLIMLMQSAEAARNAAWLFLLFRLLGDQLAGTDHILAGNRWIPWFALGCLMLVSALYAPLLLPSEMRLSDNTQSRLTFATWLTTVILALLLLEQIFRNSTIQERWSIKHLCLGLGVILTYDFFMYAEAELDANLWQARGFVTSIAALFIAVAVGRMERPESESRVYLSRHVAFHSVTLLATGVYLLLMALAGYFIQYVGGSWGGVLQITFLFASGLLLLVLLFSGQIRARLRVWLSKNFFSYKYDYRVEWLNFTEFLAQADDSVLENIIQAIGRLAQSSSGLLWGRTEDSRFTLMADWEMAVPDTPDELGNLPQWLEETEWIIDLKEWKISPDLYEGLEIPALIWDIPRAWLLIPLMLGSRLQGILLLRESDLQPNLNWEDRDLLKVAGRQAASHLAQHEANRALVESRQFEAFNRLSAYVVHDLKNILAQQSLIVSNADKHRHNPEFFDDTIDTIANSVDRMTRLMEQMRSGVREIDRQQVELVGLLKQAVASRCSTQPVPKVEPFAGNLYIDVDREHLATVFSHIIQNAQEATSKDGQVSIRLSREGEYAVVEIEDDGIGMDESFLNNRLFKPFDSTKGLTGMGIGAFESREFVLSLGGDIHVSSEPGLGSLFRIVIPCYPQESRHEQINKGTSRE
jgi:putative PEP-CTERM system histidine kinase